MENHDNRNERTEMNVTVKIEIEGGTAFEFQSIKEMQLLRDALNEAFPTTWPEEERPQRFHNAANGVEERVMPESVKLLTASTRRLVETWLEKHPRSNMATLARHMGVHPTTIGKWRSGTGVPHSKNRHKLEYVAST